MTARTLPQVWCSRQTDHPAHSEFGDHIPPYRCPGRHTPSNYRAPHVSPAQPEDPFAGIPGADEDEE